MFKKMKNTHIIYYILYGIYLFNTASLNSKITTKMQKCIIINSINCNFG